METEKEKNWVQEPFTTKNETFSWLYTIAFNLFLNEGLWKYLMIRQL